MPLNKKVIIESLNSDKFDKLSNKKVKVFKVCKTANKQEILAAFKVLFGDIKVAGIRTAVMPSRKATFRRKEGSQPAYKKAYITLGPGVDIKLS